MSHLEQPRTLPRRANTIRALAAQLAHRKMTEDGARQAVSDRIGYLVAAIIGAAVFRYLGWSGVQALGILYAASAWLAHRRWKKVAP